MSYEPTGISVGYTKMSGPTRSAHEYILKFLDTELESVVGKE
jgi:hypothetical protein